MNPPPEGLWAEDSEWVWLEAAAYESPAKAKYAAFAGKPPLPFGFREIPVDLTEMTCRVVYARPGQEDEVGWAGRGEETWWRCEKEHPNAVKFYEVGC